MNLSLTPQQLRPATWTRPLVVAAALLVAVTSAQAQCYIPIITEQPKSQTVVAGDDVTFTVTFTDTSVGITNWVCDWFFNGLRLQEIQLTNNQVSTIVITNAQLSVDYSVQVWSMKNDSWCAMTTSRIAFLDVVPLQIDRVVLAGAARNQLVLQFNAVSNHTYSVEGSRAVAAGSWTNIMSIAAQSSNRVESVMIFAPPDSGYFRLATTHLQ